MMDELLAEASSPLENKLAAAFLDNRPNPQFISTLWDAYRCPSDVLPYLGWAQGVHHWSSNWSEATQRLVVANAPQVHAEKGTRQSIERVLLDLGLQAKIIEWFEADPPKPPGTFEIQVIKVLGDSEELDNGNEHQIQSFVDYAKPISRKLSKISVDSTIHNNLYSAASAKLFRTIRV